MSGLRDDVLLVSRGLTWIPSPAVEPLLSTAGGPSPHAESYPPEGHALPEIHQ